MDPVFVSVWLAVVLLLEVGLFWVVARSDGWKTAAVAVLAISGVAVLAGIANYAALQAGAS